MNPVRCCVLAGAYDAFDEFDDIGTADGAEVPRRPFRQDVDSKVPLICLNGTWSLAPFGVLDEVAIRQRLEGACRSALAFYRANLDGIFPIRNLRGHLSGALACGFQRRCWVGANRRTQCLARVGVPESKGKRSCAVARNSQHESGLAEIRDLQSTGARGL